MGSTDGFVRSYRRFTRRQMMVGAAKAAAITSAVGAFSGLLAACGGSSGSETPTSASSSGGTTPAATSAASTQAPASTSAATSAASTATSSGSADVVKGGTLTYGTLGDLGYGSLDMTTTTGTYDLEIGRSLNDPYIWLTQDGNFVPGLAEKWEISDDALAYTFKLRDGLVFHDGVKLDAAAAKANFDRMTSRDTNPSGLSYSYLGAGTSYGGCEVVDPLTFKISLKEPNAIFLFRMRRKYVSPQSPAAIEKYGKDYFRNPVGAGPFKFVEWVEGDHVTMEANPDYNWGPKEIFGNTGKPYLDKIVLRIFKDLTTKATALEAGELDYAARLNPEDIQRFQDSKDLKVELRDQTGQSSQMELNVEKAPTDDIAVRQAIGWAIDREALVKSVFFGFFEPATHLFTPNMFSYDESLNSLFGYDLAKAEKILDDAGWTKSGDSRSKDGQQLSLVWLISQESQPLAQFAQAELKKVGIAVELKTLAGAGLQEAALKGEHNIYAEGHWIQEDPDVTRNWAHSKLIDVRQNYVRAHNDELDQLLDQGIAFKGDPHSPDRAKIYQQIQKIIMSNYYIVPLYYDKSFEAYQNNVHADNIGYDPYGVYHEWSNVWMEK